MKSIIYLLLVIFPIFALACEDKSDYERIVESELEKGIRNDSLFLGYYFGMNEVDFFEHSWELNQKNIITGDNHIIYVFDELESRARMTFYPEFKNGKIYKVPVEVSYDGWAPWNRNLSSDSLLVDLKKFFHEKLDGEFIQILHPELQKQVLMSVNGNRRIVIYKKDEKTVQVEFTDILSMDDSS